MLSIAIQSDGPLSMVAFVQKWGAGWMTSANFRLHGELIHTQAVDGWVSDPSNLGWSPIAGRMHAWDRAANL